jgi:hypothetical protein
MIQYNKEFYFLEFGIFKPKFSIKGFHKYIFNKKFEFQKINHPFLKFIFIYA